MKRMRTVLLFIFMAVPLWAQSGSDYYFQQGNKAYRESDYQTAIQWYEKILTTGHEGSQVYYILGNSYYKLNQNGRAILYYEKALRLAPEDAEIQFNLELANLRVKDRIELPPQFFLFRWWDGVLAFFSLSQLTWLVAGLYGLTMLLLVLLTLRWVPGYQRWVKGAVIACAVVGLFLGYLLYVKALDHSARRDAIILTPSVTVLSEPSSSGSEVFVLHEGAKITVAEQRGEWSRIVLVDGKSGWMKIDHYARI